MDIDDFTSETLKAMFKNECKHLKEYTDEERNQKSDFRWQDCTECSLCEIGWILPKTDIDRDLCFALWHEGILEQLLPERCTCKDCIRYGIKCKEDDIFDSVEPNSRLCIKSKSKFQKYRIVTKLVIEREPIP